MKLVNARLALIFALFIGVAVGATLIASAGSRGLEAQATPQQPASMSIPF
jgi:hypothetical protein